MDNEIMSYDSAKDIIRRDLESMSRKFITIGYYLKMIRDNEMYRQDGFKDIWEFAQDTYGISKSTCSRWMAMNDKFSQDGNSPYLKEEYRDFGKSQLQEMLYLTDEQMEQARPDMTAKEIREIRKPRISLIKPGEREREYLNAFARHLIRAQYEWFLEDYMNRVIQVEKSPEELKRHLGPDRMTQYFPTDKGNAKIDMHEEYIQLWNENWQNLGCFEWFYLAASIQSMWNEVSLEKAEERVKPYDRGCITGKNPNGNCVCCGYNGAECCAECEKDCNSRCGWIDAAIVQQEEQIQGQMEIQDYPEALPEEKTGKCLYREEMLCTLSEKGKRTQGTGEDCYEKCCWECPKHGDCHLECIASSDREQQESVAPAQPEENQEDYMNPPEDLETKEATEESMDHTDQEERYEELSDKTDMELLKELLDGAQEMLKLMDESYTENDVRVRKQKLMIGAYAGMIADLDQEDIPETIQPELPLFKNNDQRKEWLRNYQDWGLWYEDKNIGARYYKYDFDNGAHLIVEEYTRPATEWYGEHITSYLHLVGGPEPPKKGYIAKWNRHEVYDRFPSNETELVEFLKYIQKER